MISISKMQSIAMDYQRIKQSAIKDLEGTIFECTAKVWCRIIYVRSSISILSWLALNEF